MAFDPASRLSLHRVLKLVDASWLMARTEELWKKELGATCSHNRQAAQFVEQLLRESGLERVERIATPADGRTVYFDRTMPLAWEATRGRLTIVDPASYFADPVVADFERNPFHLARGSVSTPPEGVHARLITEQQFFGGQDPRGAMVMLEPDTTPNASILTAIADLGALGFVSCQLTGRYQTPDAVRWLNACTEGAHWDVHADDRPFIGFSVSPRIGDQLLAEARAGETIVHVLSDGRRYEGEFDTVTGVIPGRDEREIWLMGHLYEPMADDNSAGVIGSIEVARLIRRMVAAGELPEPRFTLRLVFSREMYGFAAYAASRGVPLRDRALGAVNFDSIPVNPQATLYLAPAGAPFFGDYLAEQLAEEHQRHSPLPHITLREQGFYSDEAFLNDPGTGLPIVWMLGSFDLWHNSTQTMEVIRREHFAWHTAFYATYLARLLTLDETQQPVTLALALQCATKHLDDEARSVLDRFTAGDDAEQRRVLSRAGTWLNWRLARESDRLRDFARIWPDAALDRPLGALKRRHDEVAASLDAQLKTLPRRSVEPDAKALQEPIRNTWAAGLFPDRTGRCQPHDQAAVPKPERVELPGRVIYGPLAILLAHADGTKSVKDLVEYAEWTSGGRFSDGAIKRFISALEHLAQFGYLQMSRMRTITKAEIARALRQDGLREGDLALVHSSLSQFGHIEGGADAVIDAFLEVLGESGTLLMPTFTDTIIYIDGVCRVNRRHRPFGSPTERIWVGRIPRVFCARPGVRRSVHPTHSVAGLGPLAEVCLSEHLETDPPTCRRSPFGKLLDHRGKMVWFGAGLASTTFFHLLEDELDLPYLAAGFSLVQRPDGRVETVRMPKHLPGHRDFYHSPGEKSKMYRRLIQDGLQIASAPLGLGWVKVIEAEQLYELGMNAVRADPRLLLCDRPDCLFCRRFGQV